MIPDTLARKTTERLGTAGAEWLHRLPEILAECEQRWALSVGPPFALSYNYVAAAVRADGTASVLKLGYPLDKELRTEAEALKLFGGRGIAWLLELDLDQGALLLERLEPGTPLAALLHNPLPGLLAMPWPDRILARRVAQLAEELGFDRERICSWALAQAVLSAVWSLEDHGHGWEKAISCAEILAAIKS